MQGRDIATIIGVVVLAILLLGLLGGSMMFGPWMMGWGGYGMGAFGPGAFGWWGIAMGIGMLLFWVLIIGGAVWLFTSLFRQARPGVPGAGPGRATALDILRERYARGEITKEQFDQMRRDIEG